VTQQKQTRKAINSGTKKIKKFTKIKDTDVGIPLFKIKIIHSQTKNKLDEFFHFHSQSFSFP